MLLLLLIKLLMGLAGDFFHQFRVLHDVLQLCHHKGFQIMGVDRLGGTRCPSLVLGGVADVVAVDRDDRDIPSGFMYMAKVRFAWLESKVGTILAYIIVILVALIILYIVYRIFKKVIKAIINKFFKKALQDAKKAGAGAAKGAMKK